MMEVFYRIYPGSIDNRPFFDGDKLALTYLCLRSFTESCCYASKQPAITFLLDGCPESWEKMVRHVAEPRFDSVRVFALNGVGNQPSFRSQLGLALESKEDTIFLAEDDYLYRREAMREMYRFAKSGTNAFWTPYDHPDRYNRADNRDVPALQIRTVGDCHWRTAESACMTFGGPKSLFLKVSGTLHAHGCTGRQMWYPIIDEGYGLWSPIPAIATHMEVEYMSPGVDWTDTIRWLLYMIYGHAYSRTEDLVADLLGEVGQWR
jgi:hypothetical protein